MFNIFIHWFEVFKQADSEFQLDFIMTALTFVSVWLFYIDYRHRKKKERAEKSIIIAEEFSKNIIPKFNQLTEYLTKCNILKSTQKSDFLEFECFTQAELLNLCSNSKNSYTKTYVDKYKKAINKNVHLKVDGKKVKVKDFVYDLLNELECMCMYIATKVADEKYIYHSLHDKFFKVIHLTYIAIAISSDNQSSKNPYYISTIKVFNLWKKKHIRKIEFQRFLEKLFAPKQPTI